MKPMHPAGRMWRLYKMGGITPALTSMFDPQSAQQMAFIRQMMKEQRKEALHDIPLQDMEAVVFDLETTGFAPYNGDEIISFGGVATVGGEMAPESTFYSLVNPKRDIPPHISELTGITNGQAGGAPELMDVLQRFLSFVQQKALIAHGAAHDKGFLNAALWKTSRVSLNHRVLDTMMIAKWLLPRRRHYDLDTLLHEFGIPVTQRHHALEDALMTARLWTELMAEIKARHIDTLGDLYEQLSRHH
ncbi:DNA polymerase III subunit epsilon [Gordoniibacillus kamchatkensis]|uniref:DNA polymerase III subunit epsilon n=1 Tax=Gordoniibacillus kamchatkensis TaxID=1590651 RepID=A0ABR5AC43_9BACL|nr:exonuclease domain-containing protein [Paenibacillus sp. VKM B-2647]KIL38567.1 DNA polymerase III subunit epsilon [Paenibacillus sp. VKM B-2647]